MIYEIPIRVEITDTELLPKRTDIKLTRGVIHQLDLITSESCQRTLYLAIYHGGHQIFPTNPDEYFRLGGEPFSYREAYKLFSIPYELTIYVYLKNADNWHDATVRIAMLDEDDLRGVKILWSEER